MCALQYIVLIADIQNKFRGKYFVTNYCSAPWYQLFSFFSCSLLYIPITYTLQASRPAVITSVFLNHSSKIPYARKSKTPQGSSRSYNPTLYSTHRSIHSWLVWKFELHLTSKRANECTKHENKCTEKPKI